MVRCISRAVTARNAARATLENVVIPTTAAPVFSFRQRFLAPFTLYSVGPKKYRKFMEETPGVLWWLAITGRNVAFDFLQWRIRGVGDMGMEDFRLNRVQASSF